MSFSPDAFAEAFSVFATHERMDPLMLLCKLTEESGELAEAVLVQRGYKPHKTLPADASIDEAADVLLCLLLVLSRLYPERSPAQLAAQLAERIDGKLARYVARQPMAQPEH
jgi:NTP pyrophosphatase (non-canonical NTP hydrolase)